MKSKLNLDPKKVAHARDSARKIAQGRAGIHRQTYYGQHRKNNSEAAGYRWC